MKQYTTPEQTAKLIELGFEKPRNERWVLDVANETTPSIQNIVKRQDYSIGELIEMLPTYIDSIYSKLVIQYYIDKWKVSYNNLHNNSSEYENQEMELIDAIFNICIKLKEKGVI